MPAIYLEKLKLQSANLAGKFSQPEEFLHDLLELFEYYSNRTFRAGNNTLAGRLLASYHLPDRVLWQIERDLESQVKSYSQEDALRLANLLWKGESLEEKKLAVFLLGRITIEPHQPVLDTYQRWFKEEDDPAIRNELVTEGLFRLRREALPVWSDLIRGWITDQNEVYLGQGYLALAEYLRETGDQNVPVILNIIRPSLLEISATHHPEMLGLMQKLFQVSPIETIFILQEEIQRSNPRSAKHKRILRKIVQIIPPEHQGTIKLAYLEHFREKSISLDDPTINN
jgi:hypothetical protein